MSNSFIKMQRDFRITKSLDESGEFEGYASVFGIEDHHGDTVAKGAFKVGLQKLATEKRKLKMLYNHRELIGVFKEADEDDTGLFVRGKLSLGVQKADETRILMRDEALDSMSIGGYLVKARDMDKRGIRKELQEIHLREISPVVFPALDAARITSVKSLSDEASLADVEVVLRDAGFSRTDTKRLISIIKGVTPQRDVEQIAGSFDNLQSILKTMKG